MNQDSFHPPFKRTGMLKTIYIFKNLQESVVQQLFGVFHIFGIAHTYLQKQAIIMPVQMLLKNPVVFPASLNHFLFRIKGHVLSELISFYNAFLPKLLLFLVK